MHYQLRENVNQIRSVRICDTTMDKNNVRSPPPVAHTTNPKWKHELIKSISAMTRKKKVGEYVRSRMSIDPQTSNPEYPNDAL